MAGKARPIAVVLVGIGGCAALGALVLAGPGARPLHAQSRTTVAPPAYVGNGACAECHRKEFLQHRGSKHDITLRPADASRMAGLTPPEGDIAGTPYAIYRSGAGFAFGLAGAPARAGRVALAFGSGKTGMTYVSVGDDDQQIEFRMSRIPSSRSWYITPGQEGRADIDLGMVHTQTMTRRCIGCHATGLTDPKALRPNQFGVGCESCHGPGSDHVAAARIKGNADLRIEKMSRWNARQINELCARCHRSERDVSLVTRDASSTQRFQPYGLMMSPCFKKSGGKLSCATCHNSHVDVSTDEKKYERVCISCHPSAGAKAVKQLPGASNKPCPVNPKEKCVGCHMPATQIFPGSKLPVKMADHMIWAYGKRRR